MNKTVKKIVLGLTGVIVLCIGILVFHVITAKPEVVENSNLQISRIDFESNIDSLQAKEICADLRTIKGITSDSIIVKRNVVVYFHNNKITNSKKVYTELMNKRPYNAKPFVLPASLANKEVCPLDKNSFSYKLLKTINQFFT